MTDTTDPISNPRYFRARSAPIYQELLDAREVCEAAEDYLAKRLSEWRVTSPELIKLDLKLQAANKTYWQKWGVK